MPELGVCVLQTEVPADIRHRASEDLQLDSVAANTGTRLAGASAGRSYIVRVRAAQVGAAAVDVFDNEIEAVERIELEVLEQLMEHSDVDVDPVAVELGAQLKRVDRFRPELQGVEIALRKLRAVAT